MTPPAIAALVRATLDAAGEGVDPVRANSVRATELAWGAEMAEVALRTGGRAVIDRAAASLDATPSDVDRVLGFGHHLGDAMAQLVGAPRPPVARLAAQLNLAICFFDRICDRFPARLPILLSRLDERGLEQLIAGNPPAPRTGDDGVDGTVALFASWFEGVARLGEGAPLDELRHTLRRMHRGELAITGDATRAPSLGVLRALRAKSALPFWAMALPALTANATRRAALRDVAMAAGEAVWIVDDLCDILDDVRDDMWSRPLWRLERAHGQRALDPDEVVEMLLDSDILADEARRLASRLARIHRSGAPALHEALRVGVDSWLGPDGT